MVQENISLQAYNTFGVDAKARFFVTISNVDTLQQLLAAKQWKNFPKFILGEGSNILFTEDFPGLVIKTQFKGIHVTAENDHHVWLTVGAGEIWHHLVLFCLEKNFSGIENLSLIPGTVGAAPIQNIGAYGVELETVFDHLTAMCLSDGSLHTFDHSACQFGYRDSVFKTLLKNQFAIVTVTLRLNKKAAFFVEYDPLKKTLHQMGVTQLNIKVISDAIIKIRSEKLPDPKNIGNAGSFFKNPIISIDKFHDLTYQHPQIPYFLNGEDTYKIPAAWLIEKCGWKGRRIGNVGTHQQHALVLVNYGNGSGKEIKKLAEDIQNSVREQFSIDLHPEVNIL